MSKLYLYAIIGAAALAAFALFTLDQRNIGRDQERAKQEKTNESFRNRAVQGGHDFDACDKSGGLWDFRKRSCQLP